MKFAWFLLKLCRSEREHVRSHSRQRLLKLAGNAIIPSLIDLLETCQIPMDNIVISSSLTLSNNFHVLA